MTSVFMEAHKYGYDIVVINYVGNAGAPVTVSQDPYFYLKIRVLKSTMELAKEI